MSLTTVSELAGLSGEEAERYFAEEDPERIVALVDGAPDRELRALVEKDHIRHAALVQILARLDEFALPEPLSQVRGVVEFVVDVHRGQAERHALRFDGRTVTPIEPGQVEPDVSLRLDALDLLRMATGGTNAALLLLGGRLRVEGDAELALRTGGVFRVPGRPGVAVDPNAVDPEQVAAVLRGVKDSHLREVMSGGFREVVLTQVFRRLPDFLNPEKAAKADLSVGFKITGRPDGGADRYAVRIVDGTCEVERDGEATDATIVADGAAFLKLVTGHLNPVVGVMRGALKVRGDVTAGLELHRIMRIPGQG